MYCWLMHDSWTNMSTSTLKVLEEGREGRGGGGGEEWGKH